MIHTINDFNFYGNNSINTDEVIKALEMSKVLHLNNFSFELTAAEAKTFLTPTILDQNAKNISYNPNTQALKGTKVQNSDEEKLLQHILSQLHPGAIILLHDTCKITAEILPRLIAGIRERGYRFDRIDKLLKISAYA